MNGDKTLIVKSYPRIRKVKRSDKVYYQVDPRKAGHNFKQQFFPTEQKAKDWRNEFLERIKEEGLTGVDLPREDRLLLLDCKKRLRPFNIGLKEAVDDFIKRKSEEIQKAKSKEINGLVDEWIQKSTRGTLNPRRKRTCQSIQSIGNRIKKDFGKRKVQTITREEFKSYLFGLNVEQQTKRNIRTGISQFYNWCVKNEYTDKNPLLDIDIRVIQKPVEIFPIDECKTLLKNTLEHDFDLIPYLTICLFGGLRPGECEKLDFKDINLSGKQIYVRKSTSKIKDDRYVPIEPVLLKWLSSFGNHQGLVIPQNFRRRFDKVRKLSGYRVRSKKEGKDWIQDGLRHTYGSMWLAKNKKLSELAEHMGNSEYVIRKHYRKVVSEKDWKIFWALTPITIQKT